MKEILEKLLREELGADATLSEIVKLHGDASYRTYYRAILSDGSSLIVMQMPEGKSSVSEEITNFNGTHKELPFVNVARYLSGLGLPVPTIRCYSETHHLMLLEDLGDGLMARAVENASEAERRSWYEKAIDLLALMQQRTRDCDSLACVACARSFDAHLLNWEFDHFREYCVEARAGKAMDEEDRRIFKEETRSISAEIERMPYGFTHRDFQSRNLIIKNGSLYMIDFQDALKGPFVYDLVALTRDSYVKLADETVDSLISYYASKAGRGASDVRGNYDLVTVQRKLKDAGRFVFIDRVKKNPNFLKYIPTSLGYARAALERLPAHRRLHALIERYLPEWR
ncbi:MAG: phosphotransferase [bacterium]